MNMLSTEMVLLIVSLTGNIIILLKRIKIFYTPCLIIQCDGSNNDNDRNSDESNSNSNENHLVRLKNYLSRYTPRLKQNRVEIKTEIKNDNNPV